MAQITVQDVYNGAKYDVMNAAVADNTVSDAHRM